MKLLFARLRAAYVFVEYSLSVFFLILAMRLFPSRIWQMRRLWAKSQQYLLGYREEVVGSADPDAQLVLMNHQSILDIPVVDGVYPKNLAWVAKKEIEAIPFYGQIMTLPEMISIDREDRRSLVALFKKAKDRLQKGRVIAMFPEGTRGDGQRLLPFKQGAKLLAEKLDLRVQPIVIVHTRHIIDSKKFTAHGGKAVLVYLDPIDPKSDPEWFDKLHQKMQEVLTQQLSQLSINP